MAEEINNSKIITEFQTGYPEIVKIIDSFVEKGYDAMSIYLIMVFGDKIAKVLLKDVYPKANEEKFRTVSQLVDIVFEAYQAGLEQKKKNG
jgi:hypothetical protein